MKQYISPSAAEALALRLSEGCIHVRDLLCAGQHEDLIRVFEDMMHREDVRRGCWTIDFNGLPDTGFIFRQGEANPEDKTKYDRKVFFHYRPGMEDVLADRGIDVDADAGAYLLLTLARDHYNAYLDLAIQIAQAHQDPSLGSALRRSDAHVLRLLAYTSERGDSSDLIAQAHLDQGLFTFAVASSTAGLEFFHKPDGPYASYAAPEGYIIAFPGAKWQQRYNTPALWHHVRRTQEPRYSKDIIRWAIVFFVHTDDPLTLRTKP